MDGEAMRAEFEKWWFGEDTSRHPQNTFSGADRGTEHWVYEGWLRGTAAEREACADLCEGHYDTKQAARAIRARSE